MNTEPNGSPAPAQGDAAANEPTPSLVVGDQAADTPPAGSEPGGEPGAPGQGQGEEKKAEEQTSDKLDDAKAGPPEKYEFKFDEGVVVDPTVLAKFEPVARELGLTNDQGQKLADLYLGLEEARKEAWKQTTSAWVEEVKADKDFGGENFTATVQAAQAATKRFASPALVQFLNESGFGNHPELVRCFAQIGKAMGPDSFERGGASAAPKAAEEILYPTMFAK